MVRLTAVVTDTTGWRRTLELKPETEFSGDFFRAEGRLDLAQLYGLLNHLEQETGTRRDHYTIAIAPEVTIEGTVADQDITDRFAPRLGFRLDQNQFQIVPPGPREADPRMPSQAGAVEVTRVEPAVFSLLNGRLAVADVRRIAGAGLAIALMGALVLMLQTMRARRADEPSRIRAQFGHLLVSVTSADLPATRVVNTASIGDLAKVAERSGSMILHNDAWVTHSYLVHHGDATYCYEVQVSGIASAPPAEALVRSSRSEA